MHLLYLLINLWNWECTKSRFSPGSPLNMLIECPQYDRLRPGSRSPGDEKTFITWKERQTRGCSLASVLCKDQRQHGGGGGARGMEERPSRIPATVFKRTRLERKASVYRESSGNRKKQSAAILSRQPPRITNGLRWGVSACECAYHVHGATTGDMETVEWQQVVPNSCQDQTEGDFVILHTWASAPTHFHRRSPPPDRVRSAF